MLQYEELNTRVIVVETELKNVKEVLGEVHSMTFSIKERVDKSNGSIPHLQETVKQIAEKINQISEGILETKIQETKTEFKVKLVWGSLIFVIGTLTTILINTFVN